MVEAVSQLMTLEEFWDWYPDGYGRYELRNGVPIEMRPTGTHGQVAGFLAGKCFMEIERLGLPYVIPWEAMIKPLDTDKTAYNPDVTVLDQTALEDEPFWKKRSTITLGKSIRVAIEVVSTNWRDDYGHKLMDYEALGIPEYWIVDQRSKQAPSVEEGVCFDYLGLGGRRYIGSPKQPTFFVYQLVDGEYQEQQFRGSDFIISPTFPELNLTTEQVFAAGL